MKAAKILMKSCQRSLHDLVQVPYIILHRSLSEDLVEILLNSSLRGPCMILYGSFTEDLVEILVRSSL